MNFMPTTALFGVGFRANPHVANVGKNALTPVNISNGMPHVVHKGVLAEPRNFNKIVVSRKNTLNSGVGPQHRS